MFAIDVGVQDNEFGLHTNSVLVSVFFKTETKTEFVCICIYFAAFYLLRVYGTVCYCIHLTTYDVLLSSPLYSFVLPASARSWSLLSCLVLTATLVNGLTVMIMGSWQ